MSDDTLRDLARFAGVATSWHDVEGRLHEVPLDVLRAVLAAFGLQATTASQIANSIVALRTVALDAPLPPLLVASVDEAITFPARSRFREGDAYRLTLEGGTFVEGTLEREGDRLVLPAIGNWGYHRIEIAGEETVLAVAPRRCFTIDDIDREDGGRHWGLAAPVYALRRAGDGGIGDFTALARAVRAAAAQGASAFGINPVHALFSAAPERFSPYAPSSRAFLNPLHADPASLLGEEAFRQAVGAAKAASSFAGLEALDLIDWPRAAEAKLSVFRALFANFRGSNGPLAEDIQAFRAKGGEALEDHARFEALHAFLRRENPDFDDWRLWPDPYRDPRGAAVLDFAIAHEEEVTFHVFLQWLAARGLSAAQKAGIDAGMPVGLICDLAVGADAKGSHAWSRQSEMLSHLSVGAPPDPFNSHGQNWGVAALCPHAMRPHGFRAFIEALRATMSAGGGIRIDHAMGLTRLWVTPEGASPLDGTYIHYPADDLFRLVALESWRNRAIVVGEDLGTVAEGFRERLHGAGILGTEVMWFERDSHGFFAPDVYSQNAMATTTTHDLPTVAGWWKGIDIEARAGAGVLAREDVPRETSERIHDRDALWRSLRAAGAAQEDAPPPENPEPVLDAAAGFIGMTASPLVLLPLDDALGRDKQTNMPGTFDEYPNWRLRMSVDVDELFEDAAVRRRLSALSEARRRS